MFPRIRPRDAKDSITVSDTQESELPFIMDQERQQTQVPNWEYSQHLEAIYNPLVMYHTIYAKKTDQPVGYAILKRNSPNESSVEFMKLVIYEKFRHKGYGYHYFMYIWNVIFSKPDVMRVWHEVFTHNNYAIRFYKKLGYLLFRDGIDDITGNSVFFYEFTRKEYLKRKHL